MTAAEEKEDKNITQKTAHEEAFQSMATPDFNNDIVALLRSRAPLIFLTCSEEKRLKTYFKHLAEIRGYQIYIWDCYLGCLNLASGKKDLTSTADICNPDEILNLIIGEAGKDAENAKTLKNNGISGRIFILLDFHRFIDADAATPEIERRLKTFASIDSMTHIIMTGPSFHTTSALENYISLIDFPLPNQKEISKSLWHMVDSIKKQASLPDLPKTTKANEDQIVKAASGLTLVDAQKAFAKSLVLHKKFHIPTILKEKKQIIRKRGTLEFFEPKVSMDNVGGLENLVDWLKQRLLAFSPAAEEYGLPAPRGILTLGLPGVGKSLMAKAAASLYQMPLLRLDFGRLFGSLVGESESRVREALALAEIVSPSFLWLDEVEKGLSGSKSSGQTDGGTTNRVVATFLTWMQEREAPVFVFATANDHTQIPTEFMRRFDEVFFVDLPNEHERKDIFSVLLKKYKRNPVDFNLGDLAGASNNYSGSEIEKAIVSALFRGFSDSSRKIHTKDILNALGTFKPLYIMREDHLKDMRKWAKNSCVLANRSYGEQPEDNETNKMIDM